MSSRFWVGGTGTWDAATTTHWSATSGGAGGASVPGSSDTVTFNGSSGGGTVTLNFGGTITVQSIDVSAFTGTWDNSANNNNITMTASGGGWNNNGSGTRTINLGSATYTLSGDAGTWDTSNTASGNTQSSSSANIVFTGTTGNRSFTGGAKTYGSVTLGATSTSPNSGIIAVTNATGTISSLVVTAPNYVRFGFSSTHTITSLTCSGSSSSQIFLSTNSVNQTTTLAVTSATLSWAAFRDLTFTGSPTATNSFDLGNNSGITITAPAAAGGGGSSGSIIGS